MKKNCIFVLLAILLPTALAHASQDVAAESPEGNSRHNAAQQAEGDIWGCYAGQEPLGGYILIGGTKGMVISFTVDEAIKGAQITAIRVPVSDEKDAQILEEGTVWISEDIDWTGWGWDAGTKVLEVPISNVIPGGVHRSCFARALYNT